MAQTDAQTIGGFCLVIASTAQPSFERMVALGVSLSVHWGRCLTETS